MAGNSVPAFFGRKTRSILPPGLDVTFMSDTSNSMQPYIDFVVNESFVVATENELRSQGIGLISPNRYSYIRGGLSSGNTALSRIEEFITVDNISVRWATGSDYLANRAVNPPIRANSGADNEDMGLGYNIISTNDRSYLALNARIVVAGSDEQSYATVFNTSVPYPHRYIGIHAVSLLISEPAGPSPIPAGTLIGFVYTTPTEGVAIYLDGSTVNYREFVPVANVAATAAEGERGPTLQINVDWAKTSNGAIYNISGGTDQVYFDIVGESLARVLGSYLFSIA